MTRRRSRDPSGRGWLRTARHTPEHHLRLRGLSHPDPSHRWLYIYWGLVANTFGQFLTYFLITVEGASQALATGIGLAGLPLGLITAIIYVQFADAKWRNPLFYFGMACQIIAMALAFVGGGVIALFVPASC